VMHRFSINTQADLRVNGHYGYGKSLMEIKHSLRKSVIGDRRVLVEHHSPRSRYQMYYGPHPIDVDGGEAHHPQQYKIHMSQTESDRFEEHKVKAYSSVDEFWTANEWGAAAAVNSGIAEENVHVYHHGIFPERYSTALRGTKDKVRFLHIDSGSLRKRADLVEKAFKVLHKKNPNTELTLKYSHAPHKGASWLDEKQLRAGGDWESNGIRRIFETLSQEELTALMHFHDVLIYPSEGEGFGLIPLEAMATGMPVISTYEWAAYADFFPEGHLASEIAYSSVDWGYPKVGKGTITSVDAIVDKMSEFADNITDYSEQFLSRADDVKFEWDWMNITPKFFSEFFNRVE